jgi:hypothetical protein
MKPSGRITLIAVALLMASAGTLYPIRKSMISAQSEVERIQTDLDRDQGVHDQLMAAHARMLEVKKGIAERAFSLCPNTPEAEHEFETTLLGLVESTGLHSVRMDRQPEAMDTRTPSLSLDLVVEGEAQSLQKFLQALEGMRWVTRVVGISVEPGNEVRRMTLEIAVILEQKP